MKAHVTKYAELSRKSRPRYSFSKLGDIMTHPKFWSIGTDLSNRKSDIWQVASRHIYFGSAKEHHNMASILRVSRQFHIFGENTKRCHVLKTNLVEVKNIITCRPRSYLYVTVKCIYLFLFLWN